MPARFRDESLRVELIGKLVPLARVDAEPEPALLGLDDELAHPACSGRSRREAPTEHLVEDDLDFAVVADVVENRIGGLLESVSEIRQRTS